MTRLRVLLLASSARDDAEAEESTKNVNHMQRGEHIESPRVEVLFDHHLLPPHRPPRFTLQKYERDAEPISRDRHPRATRLISPAHALERCVQRHTRCDEHPGADEQRERQVGDIARAPGRSHVWIEPHNEISQNARGENNRDDDDENPHPLPSRTIARDRIISKRISMAVELHQRAPAHSPAKRGART